MATVLIALLVKVLLIWLVVRERLWHSIWCADWHHFLGRAYDCSREGQASDGLQAAI